MELNALMFGLAAGIVWGVCVFLITIIAKETKFGLGLVNALGKIYIGEKATVGGAFLGMIYGFFDAGIGAFVLAWVYNLLIA